jgi:hypothetical protein
LRSINARAIPRTRYYDPELCRFIQADSVLDGLNRYAYCANNPIIYVDPTGLEWITVAPGVEYDTDSTKDGYEGSGIYTYDNSTIILGAENSDGTRPVTINRTDRTEHIAADSRNDYEIFTEIKNMRTGKNGKQEDMYTYLSVKKGKNYISGYWYSNDETMNLALSNKAVSDLNRTNTRQGIGEIAIGAGCIVAGFVAMYLTSKILALHSRLLKFL